MAEQSERDNRQYLLASFWDAALGFWRRDAGPTAWMLTTLVVVLAFVNLTLQYRLNVWNRAMFDALDHKDGSAVLRQSLIFLPLTVGSVGVAAASVYARMTTQRRWRTWLNAHVLDRWDQQRPLLSAQPEPHGLERWAMLGGAGASRPAADGPSQVSDRRHAAPLVRPIHSGGPRTQRVSGTLAAPSEPRRCNRMRTMKRTDIDESFSARKAEHE
jgi:hypothetical protein